MAIEFRSPASGLSKAAVGLGSVDNTSDAGKPVSTAQQTAIDGRQPLDTDLTTIAGLVATTDNIIQSVGSAWASRTPAQVKATLALAKADVGLGSVDNTADTAKPVSTAQQTALNLKAPLASPTFTGTLTTPRLVTPPVALTDAATIAVDASLGNHFIVTLGGNRTLGAPTNPTHGQRILFEIKQDGTGSRTLAWTLTAGGFIFGTDVTAPTLTTGANKTDFVGAIYNSTANLWRVLATAKGY